VKDASLLFDETERHSMPFRVFFPDANGIARKKALAEVALAAKRPRIISRARRRKRAHHRD
jgi:hypothetical protein